MLRRPKNKARAIPSSPNEPQLTVAYDEDSGAVTYIGEQILTADELLEKSGIDTEIWEVVKIEINNWEVAGKRRRGQAADGKWQPDQLWKSSLKQIKVTLKRKAPKLIQDGIRQIMSRVPSWRGKLPRLSPKLRGGKHLMEVSLYDVHFGKLAHGPTPTEDALLSVQKDYLGAGEDLLERSAGFSVGKIVIPVGNDFFNVDNWAKTTAKGTVVGCTSHPFAHVYRAGYDSLQQLVMMCREVAEVEVLWIPGNHDPATSWYLCEQLKRVFANDKWVTVDNEVESTRKYRLFGISLIGWNHSDGLSFEKLANLMPLEAEPEDWVRSVYRHIRVGHWHKAKQIRHVNRDTFHGVDVTAIPSLSVTDKWHYDNGYVGNLRTAEIALWHEDTGFAGAFPIEARSAVQARKIKAKR